MSASLPFLVTSITISNSGGTTSPTTYTLNDFEQNQNSVALAPITSQVDAGRTILNAFTLDVELLFADLAILSDARLQIAGNDVKTTLARVVLTGASGAGTITIDELGLYLMTDHEVQNNRRYVRIKATRTSISSPITVS